MIHDAGDTGPYFDPRFHSSRFPSFPTLSSRFHSFHRLRSVLNSLHNIPPFPLLSLLHFRVYVGANAAFNSGIILLLALQILSLRPIFLRGSLDRRGRKSCKALWFTDDTILLFKHLRSHVYPRYQERSNVHIKVVTEISLQEEEELENRSIALLSIINSVIPIRGLFSNYKILFPLTLKCV